MRYFEKYTQLTYMIKVITGLIIIGSAVAITLTHSSSPLPHWLLTLFPIGIILWGIALMFSDRFYK
jgi:hypothetical protein